MDALNEQDYQEDIFENNEQILVHCVDLSYSFELTVPSLPFLSLSVVYGHFSFLNSPSERRLLLFPSCHDVIGKFSNLNSPCLLRVLRSVIFQCHPEEVVEQDQEILLCWDFTVLDDDIHAVSPENPDVEDINFAPLLNCNNVVCNCKEYPDSGPVLVNVVLLDSSTEDIGVQLDDQPRACGEMVDSAESSMDAIPELDDEEDWEDELDEEDITHTLPFKCIGAAHEKTRQDHLERAEEVMRNGGNVSVKLRPEENNQYDRFAIAIDIDYGCGWLHVGYIARELTKYLHPLMQTHKITCVSLEHIKFRVYFAKIGFYPKLLITRKGAWEGFVLNRSRSVR